MGRAQVARNQVTLGVGPWCTWNPNWNSYWIARAESDSKLKTMRDTLYDGVSGCASFPVHAFAKLCRASIHWFEETIQQARFFSQQIHFNIGFSCRRCFSTSPGNICLDDFARMYVSFKTGGPSNSKGSSSQCGQNLRSLCSGWGSLCLPEASIQNQHQIKAVFQTLNRLNWSTETCELYVNRGAGHGEVLNYDPLLSYFPCEDHKKAPHVATGVYTGQVWRWASSYLPRLWLGPTNRQPDAGKAPSKKTSFHLDMDSSHIASPKPI